MPTARGAEVELRDVTVVRGGRVVLRDVSLAIEKGELVVLLGPSGAGKTTLLGALNRLVEIERGDVLIDRRSVRDLPLHELRRRVGYCFQSIGLFPHLDVAENIGITPRLLGWDRARIDARVDALLEKVELDASFRGRMPHELSGGQAQRVAVARALAAEPPLLLLDEPFGALDPDTRALLQDELRAIQRELGVTTVMVSHDLSEALALATRIVVLVDGNVAQVGAPRDVVTHPSSPAVAGLVRPALERARALAELERAPGDAR